jgi:hypothetical protein
MILLPGSAFPSGRVRRLVLPVLAIVLALACLSWFCYVSYALRHYRGDGFGNLPADAPAFMRRAKDVFGITVLLSVPTYVLFLIALLLDFRGRAWPARVTYLLLLLAYPVLCFVLGFGFILW